MADLDQHLAAIAAGGPDAFGQWLAGAEPRLRGSLRRFAADVDTEAVLQEALLRVWQVAPRVVPDGRPNSLLRLGVRIAYNLAISELRGRRAQPADTEALERALVQAERIDSASAPDPHLRRAVEACRDRLPRQPKRALAQRLSDDSPAPDHELAARLGMRTNTFLQNIARARKLLAECLRRLGIDLELELS